MAGLLLNRFPLEPVRAEPPAGDALPEEVRGEVAQRLRLLCSWLF